LRCSNFHKALSVFIDDEMKPREREQMEIHISQCDSCRREVEKLKEMVGIMRVMPDPEIPAQLWESTRRRLEADSEEQVKSWIFRIPKWSYVPAAAALLILLVFFAGSQFYYKGDTETPTFDTYVQEHLLSYSDRILPPDLLSELTVAQTGQIIEDTTSDESTSELETLMEVHYGIDSTNGS